MRSFLTLDTMTDHLGCHHLGSPLYRQLLGSQTAIRPIGVAFPICFADIVNFFFPLRLECFHAFACLDIARFRSEMFVVIVPVMYFDLDN